ncbi:hypothetical protein, partial [Erwinia amylovora]|uniref:hypothetical protein n=1 Tax=Erwinia amylovora TaxID=552 RepID=UPI0023EA4F5E
MESSVSNDDIIAVFGFVIDESPIHCGQTGEDRVRVAETLEAAQEALPAAAGGQPSSVSESA